MCKICIEWYQEKGNWNFKWKIILPYVWSLTKDCRQSSCISFLFVWGNIIFFLVSGCLTWNCDCGSRKRKLDFAEGMAQFFNLTFVYEYWWKGKENLFSTQTENKINGWTFVSVALCNTFAILDLNFCKNNK